VLFAGMWFTVLRPKPDTGADAPAAAPTAPGVTGLSNAVNKANGAAAASDAADARTQSAAAQASGDTAAPASKPAATKATAAKAARPATKAATKKPAAKAGARVDPSTALLKSLAKGKTVVLLFRGAGADDRAARKAVHRVALSDKKVVAAYAPVSKVGAYEAITSGVRVSTSPTILVIGTDRKATVLTGFVDANVVRQAVGDARRAAAKRKK
jgi:hypothetical protein